MDTETERQAEQLLVRIIGHRGMGKLRPGAKYGENSIPGFVAALDVDADGIEFDVHLTADNDVIVHHDYHLGRVTEVASVDGVREIRHLPAGELTRVQLVGEVPSAIPTLSEVVERVGPVLGDREMWVELKRQVPTHNRRLVERTLDILTASSVWPQVVLRSFDNEALVEARKLRDDARVHSLSVTRPEHAVHLARRHGFEGVAIYHSLVREGFCAPACRAGLTVTAGGEPAGAEIDRILHDAFVRRDIHYICTNEVEYALARRREIEAGGTPGGRREG